MDLNSLSPQEQLELAQKLSDPKWFAENMLLEPSTRKPFKSNYVQEQIFGAYKRGPRVAIRVHRRAGKSYGISILALHGAYLNDAYQVLVFAPQQKQVDIIFRNIRAFIDASPGMLSVVKNQSKAPQQIEFTNGSTILGICLGQGNSKTGAVGARGGGADLILLDEAAFYKEGDWVALLPIMEGDIHRREARILMASTPTVERGRYWQFCTMDESNYSFEDSDEDAPPALFWEKVHVPVTLNPDWTAIAGKIQKIRATASPLEWVQEWMAEFPDVGQKAFKASDIDDAKQPISYLRQGTVSSRPRVMGVDWDVVQAGVNIAIVEFEPGTNMHTVIYRCEVPRQEYGLNAAVEQILKLNETFQPNFIYVDQGFGHKQVEDLKLIGVKQPHTKLKDRIVPIAFGGRIEAQDPATGQLTKVPAKTAMVRHLIEIFCAKNIRFPAKDHVFEKQLRDYEILRTTQNGGITTTDFNEHIIDAVMLACWGLFSHFNNPYKAVPATKCHIKPMPQVTKTPELERQDREAFQRFTPLFRNPTEAQGFRRGSIGKLRRTKI